MSGNRFNNLEFGGEGKSRQGAGLQHRGPQLTDDVEITTGFVEKETDSKYYLDKARDAVLAGDKEQALKSYSEALTEDPLCLEAWVGQLLSLLNLGEYTETKVWVLKAQEAYPQEPQLLAIKAMAVSRMGYRQEALALCDASISDSNNKPICWMGRGEVVMAISINNAEQCFYHALRYAKDDPIIMLEVARRYLRGKYYQRAKEVLLQCTKVAPKSALAWYLMGHSQEEQGFFSEAKSCYRHASQIAPDIQHYRYEAMKKEKSAIGKAVAGIRRMFRHGR